ncbi:hypothetical protein [Microbacterium sp.]|uniref:hypothetical protein n=1 Tax=Microbacterium sp. TaxID=51671 RepID=UPI003A8D798F
MENIIGTVIASLFSAAATFGGAWLLFRGKKVDQSTEETKVEASATDAFLQGQRAFQEYVDDVVDERVAVAVEGLKEQIAALEERLTKVQSESHEMNDAVRHQQTQAWLWDLRGRQGPLPMMPEPILRRLGLIHLINPQETS